MSFHPHSSLLCRNPDYEKFEAWFGWCWPRPRLRAQRRQWTFKKRLAWAGWRAARDIPYVEPQPSMTRAVIKPLTPEDLVSLGL